MDRHDELIRIFSKDIRMILTAARADLKDVQEIRLRAGAPLLMICGNREFYVTPEGKLSGQIEKAYLVSRKDLKETVEAMSNYSLYAFEEEVRQGFLTIQGGHRIGLAGKVILDGQRIRGMKFITFLNVRLSHQVKGCADRVLPYLYRGGEVCHTLLISPPRCGKTTLLRDLIRQISDGGPARAGMTVGVVDERSEIGACFRGEPQNDLGIRTDVLDCCPKALGMLLLLRSMSPQVIAVDEIGGREDLDALEYVRNCGCRLVATIHGSSLEDVWQKPVLKRLREERWFERYILLDNRGQVGNVAGIYDGRGRRLDGGGQNGI